MSDLEEQLYAAVNSNDVELAKLVLRKGGNVNSLVHSGCTILGRAAQLGHLNLIQVLLNAEDYLPPEDDVEDGAEVKEDLSESPLEPKLLEWSEDFQTEVRKEYLTPMSEHEWKCEETSYGQPHANRRGLGLFQSLYKYASHRRKCDVNLPDFYDRMPLHYAAEAGQKEIVTLLLKSGCRVNVSDSENITPLHLAVSRGHEEVTEILLKAGSRVNSKTSDKSSALHIAASRGYDSIVLMLLKFGAKVDILDASDRTPLLLAVSRANHEVVKILLKHGAKVNIQEIHGYTPLTEAVWQKDCELVQILLDVGAKVTRSHHLLHYCIMHRSFELTKQLIQNGAFVNIRDDRGDTPLHIAVRGSQVAIIKELIQCGGSVNMTNSLSGQTLLHEAVDGMQERDIEIFRVILQILLQKGCQLNVESFTPGDTPLYRAILIEKFCFAEELIKNGSDVNLGHVYSCNIDNLCLARRKNNFHTVKLLVYAGFHLWRTPWLEILPSSFTHSYTVQSIKGWLIYMKRNPINLVDLCRIVIRHSLRDNIIFKVQKLQVPLQLKRFLLLEDIVKESETVTENNNISS